VLQEALRWLADQAVDILRIVTEASARHGRHVAARVAGAPARTSVKCRRAAERRRGRGRAKSDRGDASMIARATAGEPRLRPGEAR